jgi:GT2 family glycosyltransferase
MSKISVIIVSWNACNYLRKCLTTIAATGGTCVREVIVVDNASKDGSPEMVAAEFPTVTLIQTGQNLGFARANNVGIHRATGDYLALVNSDVELHADCFQQLIAYLEAHPKAGLIGPKVLGGDGLLQRTCRRLPTVWNTMCRTLALDDVLGQWPLFSGREMRHWDHQDLMEVEVLSGCFWLARKSAVDQVGGLDERFFFYAEDVDWCKRFRAAGWQVVFVPTASATHYGGASSSNAPLRFSVEMLRANLTYWKKHYGLAGQAVYYVLSLLHHAIRAGLYGLRALSSTGQRETSSYKCRRSLTCLRWLLGNKQVTATAG